jgi:redox-sensitive bicupin YhaK (pirin superfamily)
MILRKAETRGHAKFDWLDTWHTFSFGDYYDPNWMGFRDLRVINDDRIAGGGGFGMHPHRDMEILTVVFEGALQHRDSMGNGSTIKPGEVQFMSAGRGVAHSEFNASETEPLHLLQIWILPREKSLQPSYAEKSFATELEQKQVALVASPDGRDDSIRINQDVEVYVGKMRAGGSRTFIPKPERRAWLQLATGELDVNGTKFQAGDGAAFEGGERVEITATGPAEFIFFDLN